MTGLWRILETSNRVFFVRMGYWGLNSMLSNSSNLATLLKQFFFFSLSWWSFSPVCIFCSKSMSHFMQSYKWYCGVWDMIFSSIFFSLLFWVETIKRVFECIMVAYIQFPNDVRSWEKLRPWHVAFHIWIISPIMALHSIIVKKIQESCI